MEKAQKDKIGLRWCVKEVSKSSLVIKKKCTCCIVVRC